jgi:type IV pilus assembly protein PilV
MKNQAKKLSAGFTLLEILIALLIVSIGLLGVATLQIRGQQFNQVSYFRTQATLLSYDLMDRIRTNYYLMRTANVNLTYQIPALVNVGPSGIIQQPVSTCDNQLCSPLQLMNYDLDNWFYYLRDTLPEGQAQIVPQEPPNSDGRYNHYAITISWKNIVDDNKNTPESQTWDLQL